LVVGLYGPWGDGKTSLLNFIRQKLDKYPLITCITFNPWRFNSEEDLLHGFFTTLASALEVKLNTKAEAFGKLLSDYSSLLKVGHAGLSDVAALAGGALSHTSLETMRDRISQFLSDSHVRVVILIDDIDRMDKTEIQAVFRLVKLTADFENTAYVLAFDEQMVARAVGERFSSITSEIVDAGRNFLEKIIQIPLHLPAAKKGKLRQYCFEMLENVLSDLEITMSQDEINNFVTSFDRGLENKMTTPRMAVRYVNAVRFSMGILQSEVYLPDLLLIEGVRIFYPRLYERIRRTPELFLHGRDDRRQSGQEDPIETVISTLIQPATPKDCDAVKRLIDGLFPRAGKTGYGADWNQVWTKNKRIASSEYFDRYFTYALDETDISDRVLTEVLNKLAESDGTKRSLSEILQPIMPQQ
jgi:predicted KAP-like P-loop ATPase